MSFKRPRIPKPRLPKIKKTTNSKRKKLTKTIKNELSKKESSRPIKKKTSIAKPKKPIIKNKTHKNRGVCYSAKNCRGKIISTHCTKAECKKLGGKSWKGISGCQEV